MCFTQLKKHIATVSNKRNDTQPGIAKQVEFVFQVCDALVRMYANSVCFLLSCLFSSSNMFVILRSVLAAAALEYRKSNHF